MEMVKINGVEYSRELTKRFARIVVEMIHSHHYEGYRNDLAYMRAQGYNLQTLFEQFVEGEHGGTELERKAN
jgi:hypothetical protein